jgi:tetratricopeptide (TPR) repeat protein
MIGSKVRIEKRMLCLFLGLTGLLSAPAPAIGGQAELASLRGKVLDMAGNPVGDATIVLTDTVRGGEVKTETNDKGSFYRRGLRPGEYALTIEKEGFAAIDEELDFRAGEDKNEEFRMVAAMSGAEVAFGQGIEAFNVGDFEAAAKAFEEVTRLSPETPEGHTNLALAYLQIGKMPEGIQELEKAAELSGDFRSWAQLAMAYVQVDRLQAATRGFETALEKEHDPADPVAYESWMALGSLYFAENRVEDSLTAYENALSANSSAVDALVAAGKCEFNLGDMAKSREYFQRTIDAAPESSQAEEARVFIEEIEKRLP